MAQAGLELGNAGQGAQVLGPGLLHVQLGAVAALEQSLGDLQAAPLDAGILPGDLEPGLQGTDAHIELGHLGGHQHLDVVILGQAREIAGIRRLDSALELAPEVEFPAEVEAGAVAAAGAAVAAPGLTCLEKFCRSHRRLGAEQALGDAKLGLGLEDPQAGDPHVRILEEGLLHQGAQHGIVQVVPPSSVVGHRHRLLTLAGAVPVGHLLDTGGLIIGPEQSTGTEQQAGAPCKQGAKERKCVGHGVIFPRWPDRR